MRARNVAMQTRVCVDSNFVLIGSARRDESGITDLFLYSEFSRVVDTIDQVFL